MPLKTGSTKTKRLTVSRFILVIIVIDMEGSHLSGENWTNQKRRREVIENRFFPPSKDANIFKTANWNLPKQTSGKLFLQTHTMVLSNY